MPAGLQVFSPTGAVLVDTSVRVGKLVGSVTTNKADGSIATDTSKGTPFYYVTTPEDPSWGALFPEVSFSGNTMSWAYSDIQSTHRVNAIIMYGYY